MKEHVVENQKEEEKQSSKIEKKDSGLSDIKGSLEDLKKTVVLANKQEEIPVVPEKKISTSSESGESGSAYFDEKVSENSLENVVSRINASEVKQPKEHEKSSLHFDDVVGNRDQSSYLDNIQVIEHWTEKSHRVAAKEIASSAKVLVGDLYKKDSNFLAEGIRTLATWFLS